MTRRIPLDKDHGLAPALMFCRICGKDTNGIALLGANCNRVMNNVQKATGKKVEGYTQYGHNRIPDDEPCDECKAHLYAGGAIFIAKNTGEYLKLPAEDIDRIKYLPAGSKGALDLTACKGKVMNLEKGFWYQDEEGIKFRDPAEWAE
jgi:hypothetical protein